MNQVVPSRFLFQWSFFANKIDHIPHQDRPLLGLPDDCNLPSLGELEQLQDFATVKLAWNDQGFGVSVSVSGRTRRPECVESELAISDGIRLWIDTRNTQNVHRATRFCHYFVLLPAGGGAKKMMPIVRSLPVARSRDDGPLPKAELVRIHSEVTSNGYLLEAWFPAEVLVGFDPSTHQKIGFHYLVHDSELGDQTLAVGHEFPFESDPSLWQTVELVS